MRNRWQDYVVLLAGIYALLSPIWTDTTNRTGKATGTLIVLGVLTAIVALVALAKPALRGTDELTALFGVLLFISPWVMGYDSHAGLAWTAWAVGVITFIASVWAVPAEKAAYERTHALAS
jgi:hypothetical protein